MASSSSILTRFKTAVTIMTSRFANSIYGGEKGSELEDSIKNSSSYGEYDPLIAGHMHDGGQGDGHAQRIHIGGTGTEWTSGPHIRGELQHENLSDSAVFKNNVISVLNSETNSNIIPWRDDLGSGNYKYYLNLTEYTSSVVGALTLDSVATAGNKTDQLIGLGSDSLSVESHLQILGDGEDDPSSSVYSHIKLINKNAVKSSPDVGYITYKSSNSDGLWLYAKNESEASYGSSPSSFNGIQINAYDTTYPPTEGVIMMADIGNFVINANEEFQVNAEGMATIYSEDTVNIQSRIASGIGIQIESLRESTVQIVSHRSSGFGPGINLETWSGSPIHIGTQTFDVAADPTEEVRFTSEQFNFHSPIRSVGVSPVSSYPYESDFINIYDKADIDGTKSSILTIDLGNKTANSSNSSVASNNAKIYLGKNSKKDSVEKKDVSLYIRDDFGPKIYLDDRTSGGSPATQTGIIFAGATGSSPVSNQSYVFGEIVSGKEDSSLVPSGNYGGSVFLKTFGSERVVSGLASSPYSVSSYASIPRLGINFNGNTAFGSMSLDSSYSYHASFGTSAYSKKEFESMLSVQSETFVESDGEGNDMTLSFSQVYIQDNLVTPHLLKDVRYIEVESPDFVNKDVSSSVTPKIKATNIGNHTNGGISVPSGQNFLSEDAAFINFRHPVRDWSTNPTSAPYSRKTSAISEHPMILTNISDSSYVSSSGVAIGDKPMNSIPVSHPGFGGASDAGFYADVEAWMKVFVDEWDATSSSWIKKTYYMPLCSLRKV